RIPNRPASDHTPLRHSPSRRAIRSRQIFYAITRRTPKSILFPYTTLFRSRIAEFHELFAQVRHVNAARHVDDHLHREHGSAGMRDRKSTRLNSSHLGTSYADFCLKKKI